MDVQPNFFESDYENGLKNVLKGEKNEQKQSIPNQGER